MQLSDVIGAYIADRKVRGFAKSTVRNDQRILSLLLADVGNIQSRQIRPQHLDVFWAKRTTWGPGSMNLARFTLAAFFKWCRERGHLPREFDPMAGSKSIRVPPRDRVVVPQGEFSAVLESIDSPYRRAMLAIGFYLFTRISESRLLRWGDWNEEAGTIEVFRPKTNTVDTLPVCEELAGELRRWRLAYAAKVGQTPLRDWYLLPALKGGTGRGQKGTKGFVTFEDYNYVPTESGQLTSQMRRALEDAGYYRHQEGGHTLRRSGAIALYNQLSKVGHDRAIRVCQAMLGHASVQTTELYLRLDLDRKVRNDLLAGKPMFPGQLGGQVIQIGEATQHGEENSRSLRV